MKLALIPRELKVDNEAVYGKAGFEIYLVGGGVRNILLQKVPENCDLTTNATRKRAGSSEKLDPFYNNDFGTVSFEMEVEGTRSCTRLPPIGRKRSTLTFDDRIM